MWRGKPGATPCHRHCGRPQVPPAVIASLGRRAVSTRSRRPRRLHRARSLKRPVESGPARSQWSDISCQTKKKFVRRVAVPRDARCMPLRRSTPSRSVTEAEQTRTRDIAPQHFDPEQRAPSSTSRRISRLGGRGNQSSTAGRGYSAGRLDSTRAQFDRSRITSVRSAVETWMVRSGESGQSSSLSPKATASSARSGTGRLSRQRPSA